MGYWVYIWESYIRGGGLNSGGGLYSGGYIWNEVSVSTCGGLMHGGTYIRGGKLVLGGLRYVLVLERF